MNLKEANKIIDICKNDHHEHIGEFYSGAKLNIDGFFVIEELEAILLKAIAMGVKHHHLKKRK